MKIGIIGAGGIGSAFAKQAAKAGYEVTVSNSRGPESLAGLVKELGGNAKAGTVAEAAAAEVVFLAVTWNHLQEAVSSVSSWDGRIVIDAANPVIMPDFTFPDLGGKNSSEIVAEWVNGANLVKAFNTYNGEILSSEPQAAGAEGLFFIRVMRHLQKRPSPG